MQIAERGNSQELSRREFLKRGAKLGAAAVAAPSVVAILEGCGANIPTKTEVYHGPLADLEGRPLITDERFKILTQSLIDSGEPILEKIGIESRTLHNEDNPPEDISLITNPDTIPLPITRDYSGVATVSIFTSGFEEKPGFMVTDGVNNYEWPYANPVDLGINVGITKNLEPFPLHEALYLAKEHLSLTLAMRMFASFDFGDKGEILELDGTTMTNKDHLFRAGQALGQQELADTNSQFWKIVDVAPVILLTPAVIRMVFEGKIPRDAKDLVGFFHVGRLLDKDQELLEYIVRLTDMWAGSDDMKGPEGFYEEMYDPRMIELINTVYDDFYPGGKIPQESAS